MKYIAYVILGLIILNIVIDTFNYNKPQPTPINKTETVYVTHPTTHTVVVEKRKPTLGECILAPVDLVIGICNGVIQGVGYGAVYIADTCTISRLYPEDNRCIYCDMYHVEHYKCKCK